MIKKIAVIIALASFSISAIATESAEVPIDLFPVDPYVDDTQAEVPEYLIPVDPAYVDSYGNQYMRVDAMPVYLLMPKDCGTESLIDSGR